MSTVPTPPTPSQPPKKELTRAEAKAEMKRIGEHLQKLDNQRHGGAGPRTPKARLLDATALEKKDPEHHYLYVNVDDPGNLQTHIDEGYRAVSQDDADKAGVRQKVGEVVLMKIPQAEFEERVEHQKEIAQSRLNAPRSEFAKEVEGVVKELRDRGYSMHDIKRILVDE